MDVVEEDLDVRLVRRSETQAPEVLDELVLSLGVGAAAAELSIYQHLHYKRLTPIRDEMAP